MPYEERTLPTTFTLYLQWVKDHGEQIYVRHLIKGRWVTVALAELEEADTLQHARRWWALRQFPACV